MLTDDLTRGFVVTYAAFLYESAAFHPMPTFDSQWFFTMIFPRRPESWGMIGRPQSTGSSSA